MATRTVAAPAEAEGKPVGQVFADISVENSADLDVQGVPLRRVLLQGVVMDTGATNLCLPADVIATLGLPYSRDVYVQTASGVRVLRMFGGALLRFEDRDTALACIELAQGSPPQLGWQAWTALGIEPDDESGRPRKLPMGPDRTWLSA